MPRLSATNSAAAREGRYTLTTAQAARLVEAYRCRRHLDTTSSWAHRCRTYPEAYLRVQVRMGARGQYPLLSRLLANRNYCTAYCGGAAPIQCGHG